MGKILAAICVLLAISGCSYQSQRHILKEAEVGNSKAFTASKPVVYDAFMKTILMKNFIIKEESVETGNVVAERAIEKGKRTYIVSLQARVFGNVAGGSTLFLNGSERVERTYVKDNTRFFLFIIPLPGGGGKEATTIVESVKAIRDDAFYNDMFAIIESAIVPEPAEPESEIVVPIVDELETEEADAGSEVQEGGVSEEILIEEVPTEALNDAAEDPAEEAPEEL